MHLQHVYEETAFFHLQTTNGCSNLLSH